MRARGFTLIELMISIALFGLIAAAAMSLVLSGARTQSHSARVDVAQSALRTALDFITRDVMSASAGAPAGTILPGPLNAIVLTNNAAGANSADTLELYTVDGTTAAQLSSAVAASATALPITYLQASSGPTGQFVNQTTPYQSWVQVFDPTAKTAAVVQLSAAAATSLTVSALPTGFSAYAYVMPSRHVVYSVSTTTFNALSTSANTSMLMMSINGAAAQPLAEGVEDLQVAYGFDNNADGIVTEVGAAAGDDEWLYNVAGENVGAWQIANLRAVRITLVVKGTSIEGGQSNLWGPPAAEDHAGGSKDGFLRRVLRTEIAVRSFNQ